MFYPVMPGARIKGSLLVEAENEIKGIERHEQIRDMLIWLVQK